MKIFLSLFFVVLLTGCNADTGGSSVSSESPEEKVVENRISRQLSKVELLHNQVASDGVVVVTDVENVSAVRAGPDGKTLQFKLIDDSKYTQRCAFFGAEDSLSEAQVWERIPWSLGMIGSYENIGGCGHHGDLAGGYLLDSNQFAYIRLHADEGEIILEDLSSDVTMGISLDLETVELLKKDQWGKAFEDAGGDLYYYPHHDISGKGKLLLGFGQVIIGIDTEEKKFLSSKDYSTEGIVSTSYWFHGDSRYPFFVMASGWEGCQGFSAILDLNKSAMQAIDLTSQTQNGWCGDVELEHLSWNENGLSMQFYERTDLTEKLTKEETDFFADISFSEEAHRLKREEIEAKFKAEGQFADVYCALPGGMDYGCTGYSTGQRFEMTEVGGFKEVK